MEEVTFEGESQSTGAKWNTEEALVTQIGYLLAESSSLLVRSDRLKAFLCLKECRKKIDARLDDDEKEDFKNREIKILRWLKYLSTDNIEEESPRIRSRLSFVLGRAIDAYSDCLMSMLKKYGYAFSLKEDKTDLGA